jgi:carboxyl-terminal processing protease
MLSDGSALMLGAVEWLTPDGRKIWRQGIQPDVRVNLPAEVQPVLPRKLATLSPDELQHSNDTQLLRALQQLRQPVAAAR